MTPHHAHDHAASVAHGDRRGEASGEPKPGLPKLPGDKPTSRLQTIGTVFESILAGMPQSGVRGI
jgi:hypothetical protein